MWAKVDDQWWMHPDVMSVSLDARGLLVSCLSWIAGWEDEEVVPAELVDMIAGTESERLASELEDAGAWGFLPLRGGYMLEPDWGGSALLDMRRGAVDEQSLYDRDGWSCAHCGATCPGLQVDHITPWSKGGSDDLDNLQWLCPPCNASKGDRPMRDWSESNLGQAMRRNYCSTGECDHEPSARAERLGLIWTVDDYTEVA